MRLFNTRSSPDKPPPHKQTIWCLNNRYLMSLSHCCFYSGSCCSTLLTFSRVRLLNGSAFKEVFKQRLKGLMDPEPLFVVDSSPRQWFSAVNRFLLPGPHENRYFENVFCCFSLLQKLPVGFYRTAALIVFKNIIDVLCFIVLFSVALLPHFIYSSSTIAAEGLIIINSNKLCNITTLYTLVTSC